MKPSPFSSFSETNHLIHSDSQEDMGSSVHRPLTKGQLCDFLQASQSTIDQYNREGMPRFFVGKQCRYIPTKVLQWLERRTEQRIRPQIGVLA